MKDNAKFRQLRMRMYEMGISQAALAEKNKISVQSLNMKLCGKREFTLSNIKATCLALRIKPEEIGIFFDVSA